MRKNNFVELNNISSGISNGSKVDEIKNDSVEVCESDPAFCDEVEEVETEEYPFDNNVYLEEGTIFDNEVDDESGQLLEYDGLKEFQEPLANENIFNIDEIYDNDSVVIDEELFEALKEEGTIFDVQKIKNKNAQADKFRSYPSIKARGFTEIDSPFLEPISKLQRQELERKKQLREALKARSEEILAEEEIKNIQEEQTIEVEKGLEERNEPSVEELAVATSVIGKEEKRQALQEISNKIMEEKEEVQINNENKQIELGEKVKRIESPFSDVQRRSKYRASGYALANSPFLVPTKVDNEMEKKQEPIIVPERVVEKQTPIVIQNIQKSNNDEINDKLYKLSERIDELSKVILPFENMNQVLKESIKETIISSKKEEDAKTIDKKDKTNDSEFVICDVCGHINKKGSSVCEQCSNIFENA